MFKRTGLFLLLAAGLFTQPALADSERPDHYKGEPSETLEQALKNLSDYNARLQAALASDTMDLAKLNEIHQLTYTLENALNKMRADLETVSETLEAVHKASEYADEDTVKREGAKYLKLSGPWIK